MRRRTVRDNYGSLVFFIELKPISTKDPKESAMSDPIYSPMPGKSQDVPDVPSRTPLGRRDRGTDQAWADRQRELRSTGDFILYEVNEEMEIKKEMIYRRDSVSG